MLLADFSQGESEGVVGQSVSHSIQLVRKSCPWQLSRAVWSNRIFEFISISAKRMKSFQFICGEEEQEKMKWIED